VEDRTTTQDGIISIIITTTTIIITDGPTSTKAMVEEIKATETPIWPPINSIEMVVYVVRDMR